jgi:two-component system chemotaxis sensor kinase CheA
MDDDDLEELKLVFLDECQENIELLEGGLMRMSDGENDADTLNEVFRAAHSIKGGAATFGYMPMSELTHYMETLLDEMRSGRRGVSESDSDLLFTGLDILQSLLADSAEASDADHPERLGVQQKMQVSVESGAVATTETGADAAAPVATEDAESTPASGPAMQRFDITFAPNADFLARGHEPLLILSELSRLGECTTTLDTSRLPLLADFDRKVSYLQWHVVLDTDAGEESVNDIFGWVDTDCQLEISVVATESSTPATPPVDVAQDQSSVASATPAPADQPAADQAPKVVPASQGAGKAAAKAGGKKGGGDNASIRIATEKIDQLIDLVGELVITQSMLSRVSESEDGVDINELRERVADLEQHTRELQESVMQVRMLPLSSAFGRLPRLVRDLSKKLGKEVDLVVEGGSTELDKTVLERMIDPLVHLVRNALDHGLETPEVRLAAGKKSVGTLTLSARQESGSVVILIGDDGGGINGPVVLNIAREKGIVAPDEQPTDEQINQLIFAPGFSTAAEVTDVSGRGVGMDVVRRNIVDLGGRVQVHSQKDEGTTIEIRLPLSLAIMDGQLVRIGDQTFVIPILSIIETLEMEDTPITQVPDVGEICQFRGEYLSVLRMASYFGIGGKPTDRLIVVVDTHGSRMGLAIDAVLGQQQVVIKPLEKNYRNLDGLAGATIMSDGSVALILDPAAFGKADDVAEAA